MTNDEALAALTDIFRDVLGDDDLVLTPETTAADVAGWDSMSHITLVVATEQRFGIKMSTPEIDAMRNVGDFVALIVRKQG